MSKSKIQPLAAQVLAKMDQAATTTSSGIYLPENAAEKPKTATVEAVGPQVKDIKTGDQIIYEQYSGTTIKLSYQDDEYVLVPAEKVLALIVSS